MGQNWRESWRPVMITCLGALPLRRSEISGSTEVRSTEKKGLWACLRLVDWQASSPMQGSWISYPIWSWLQFLQEPRWKQQAAQVAHKSTSRNQCLLSQIAFIFDDNTKNYLINRQQIHHSYLNTLKLWPNVMLEIKKKFFLMTKNSCWMWGIKQTKQWDEM